MAIRNQDEIKKIKYYTQNQITSELYIQESTCSIIWLYLRQ